MTVRRAACPAGLGWGSVITANGARWRWPSDSDLLGADSATFTADVAKRNVPISLDEHGTT